MKRRLAGAVAPLLAGAAVISFETHPKDSRFLPSPLNVAMAQEDAPADQEQAANTLLVEALRRVAEAERTADVAGRLALLQQAQAALDAIVQDYPGSQLAVQLITGQPIGTFDPQAFSESVAEAEDDWLCGEHYGVCPLLTDALASAGDVLDASRRAEAFALISSRQVAAGLTGRAQDSLELARTTVDRIPPPLLWRSQQVWMSIAAAQAATGSVDQARRSFDQAVSAAREGSDPNYRGIELGDIAVAQAENGLFADAMVTIGEIPADGCLHLARALGAIGAEQAEAGLVEEARRTFDDAVAAASASPCRQRTYRAEPLAVIAAAQAAAGFEAAARQTFDDVLIKAEALHIFAAERASGLALIAMSQSAAGFADDALQTLSGAVATAAEGYDDLGYSSAMADIAVAQAAAGLFAEALATAGSISNASLRAYALPRVAVEQAAAGFMQEARSTFADALAAAGELPSPDRQLEEYAAIAAAQAEAGLWEDALATVDDIPSDNWRGARAEAMAAIAVAQARAGAVAEARQAFATLVETAKATSSEYDRNEMLLHLVDAQTRSAVAIRRGE